jgi:hypothetical protein
MRRPSSATVEEPLVDLHTFVLLLAVGAAVIAVWIDARFPRLAPQQLRLALAHVIAACVMANLVVASGVLSKGNGSATGVAAMLLAIALPMLVYEFLAGVWTIKVVQAVFRAHGR